MGASGVEKEEKERKKRLEEYKIKNCIIAYNSIKHIFLDVIIGNIYNNNKNKNKLPTEVYLIPTKNIPKFIIKLSGFDDFQKNKSDSELRNKFRDYEIEGVEQIYYSFEKCKKILNNNEDNEFIIVDKDFMIYFDISNYKGNNVLINNIIEIKKDEIKVYIKFPGSGKVISSKRKGKECPSFYFDKIEEYKEYKEYKDNNNPESTNSNTTNNSSTHQSTISNESHRNENLINDNFINNVINLDIRDKDDNNLFLMIKCISYSLLKIKPFFYFLECCGDLIDNDKTISKIFFDLKQQGNKKNNLDVNLYNIIKKNNKKEIIPFLFHQMHLELKVNNYQQKNQIIPNQELSRALNNFNKDGISMISEIFYFQNIISYQCQRCKNVEYKSSIDNHIKFELAQVSLFYNSQKDLNIINCFNLSQKDEKNICSFCRNNNSISYFRLYSINDILTIILDRGKNFKDDIKFNLAQSRNFNFSNIYFNQNIQQNFELIAFCSYFDLKKEFIPFYKIDNLWYYFTGSEEKELNQNDKLGTPFLLFYKVI